MKVILAGYNLDSAVIDDLKQSGPPRDDVTPETLSAAYARISRDPRSVDKLRAAARAEVQRARRSNQTIIFKMGHHSVAEHAVFNFDVIGVSRLAVEEIEKFRLCSFTEKSQRYIKLEDDFLIPQEIRRAGAEEVFTQTVRAQNALYHDLYHRLRPYFFEKHPRLAENPKKHAVLNGWAKEDARYVVSLATLGQLGMTANARNLEHMIRRLAAPPLDEIGEFQGKVYELAKEVAPSIILFTEATAFDAGTYPELSIMAEQMMTAGRPGMIERVRLVDSTPEADTRLAAALLLRVSRRSYQDCWSRARDLTAAHKRELFKTAFQNMEFYDAVLREFEFVDLTFELIVSATCFAQLKRHRLATLITQEYDPALGVELPPSVAAVGGRDAFMEVMEETEKVYTTLKAKMPRGAEYILTNAHRKRALWKVNAREFYHFSRLREDATAQWDIRSLARKMTESAEKVMPLTLMLIGGKDSYPESYARVFGRSPKLEPPEF